MYLLYTGDMFDFIKVKAAVAGSNPAWLAYLC